MSARNFTALVFYSVLEPAVNYIRDGVFSPWYYFPMMIHLILLSAALLLHGKAVKQAISTRADQRSLAATPGVVG